MDAINQQADTAPRSQIFRDVPFGYRSALRTANTPSENMLGRSWGCYCGAGLSSFPVHCAKRARKVAPPQLMPLCSRLLLHYFGRVRPLHRIHRRLRPPAFPTMPPPRLTVSPQSSHGISTLVEESTNQRDGSFRILFHDPVPGVRNHPSFHVACRKAHHRGHRRAEGFFAAQC
jgi:hypothetical protein